jgi:predicted DNA-binding transcriptional regulator YafY
MMKTADALRLAEALQQKRVLTFQYHDVERVVHPHVLGVAGEGRVALSGWQVAGTGRGWRLYHLADIHGLTITDRVFHTLGPGYNPEDPAFSEIIVRL